jgi:membrane peptidoglycan carboxypeptidase
MIQTQLKNQVYTRGILYLLVLLGMVAYNYSVPHKFNNLEIQYSNKIFDRNGIFIGYTLANNFYFDLPDKSIAIGSYDEVPEVLIKILSSVEDKQLFNDFLNRVGLRPKGVLRAIRYWGEKGGGSGIPQQLVKTLFLFNEQGLNRKITEMQVASAMYLNYSIEELVVLYLNNVSFGGNIRGFKAAAGFFYNKGLKDCTVPELSMLVGLLHGPNLYYDKNNKHKNLVKNKLAVKRRNLVLSELFEDGVISMAEFKKYTALPVKLKLDVDLSRDATAGTRYFSEYVKGELEKLQKEKDLHNMTNLNIYTTLDIKAQRAAEKTIANQWQKFPDHLQKAQVSLISLDLKTGGIVSMVGGNPSSSPTGLNRSTRLFKPVGSSFKVFFYGALLKKGFNLTDSLADREITEDWDWIVKNNDGTVAESNLSLSYCFAVSKNIPVCIAMNQGLVSPEEIEAFAHECGVANDLPNNKQIAIGGLTAGISPLQMANAYATIANYGVRIVPHSIEKIIVPANSITKARVIYKFEGAEDNKQSASKEVCSKLKTCMEDAVNYGTAIRVKKFFKGYAGGKTGTSEDNRDAWFVGFSKDYSTAIWVGFDDNKNYLPPPYDQGGKIAAPLWGAYMSAVYRGLKKN